MQAEFHYNFGELKAGDRFAYLGCDYEKISGNCAVLLANGEPVMKGKQPKIQEVPANASVYLYEFG